MKMASTNSKVSYSVMSLYMRLSAKTRALRQLMTSLTVILKVGDRSYSLTKKPESIGDNQISAEQLRCQMMKQHELFDRQGKDLQVRRL